MGFGQALLHEIPRKARRKIWQLGEAFVADAFIEFPSLKFEGVEPCILTAASYCFLFGELHDLCSDSSAPQTTGNDKKLGEEPPITGVPPQPASDGICVVFNYNDDWAILTWSCLALVVRDKWGNDCFARLFECDIGDRERVFHSVRELCEL